VQHARDVMVKPVVVRPTTSVADLARRLLEHDVDGVCVVDEGELVGVVTAMDLVEREAPVHAPVMFALLDMVLTFGQRRTEEELRKISATDVAGLMTTEVVTASSSTELTTVAGWMAEQHLSMIPVVDEGKLAGVVTRRSMVRHTLRRLAGG